MARPVVTTSIGNEGMDAVSELHLLLADAPETFATSMLRLLDDLVLQARLGAGGLQYVTERFSVTAVAERLEHVLASAVAPAVEGAHMACMCNAVEQHPESPEAGRT